jgi:transcriptional regulator with XRE-family HTH domain
MASRQKKAQKDVGKAIREARVRHKCSQEAFALQVGLHRTYVGSVERGERNISLENLRKIAENLGMKTSDLLKHASL